MSTPRVNIRFKGLDAEERGVVVLDQESGHLTLGGIEIAPSEWESLRSRVDAVLEREKLIKPARGRMAPMPPANQFLVENLPFLNKIKRGFVKRAPLLLAPFYGYVITKDTLDGNNNDPEPVGGHDG